MFGLLQQHNKYALLGVCLILASSLAQAYTLSVSPPELILKAQKGERTCTTLTIRSDSGTLSLETRWSSVKTKNLAEYHYTKEEMDLSVEMPEIIETTREKIAVCITPKDDRGYYGVLFINSNQNSATIGIWITLNEGKTVKQPSVSKEMIQSEKDPITLITGSAISENEMQTSVMLVSLASTLILSLALFVIYVRLKRREPLLTLF